MSSILTGGGILRRFLGSAVSNAAGYGVGGAILPTLEPLTQDIANEAWSLHTVKPMPASAAAQLALRGFVAHDAAAQEASYTGFDAQRFERMVELAGDVPAIETLLDLRRRGAITDAQLDRGIVQSGVLTEWRDRIKARLHVLPSVTDMVRFAVREVYDPTKRQALDLDAEFPPAFADQAQLIGLAPDTARDYWAAHWQLPSFEQGANMLYRGEISQAQFDALLKALDYAPVWRAPLQAIAKAIPSLSDMVRFAVREVYNPPLRASLGIDAEYPAPFTTQAAKHGLAEQDARDYWAAHWRLPSATQGFHMLWRGLITPTELDQLIKANDYAPVWRKPLAGIAQLVPGRIDLKRMLRHGILDRAQVKAGYQRLGYAEGDAEYLTRIAEAEMTTNATAAPWANRARSRLFTVAHNEYMDESIDAAKATELLTMVGATPAETTVILQVWDAERGVNRLELTPAQVKKAYTKGLYTRDVAIAELIERGMVQEDATTYLDS